MLAAGSLDEGIGGAPVSVGAEDMLGVDITGGVEGTSSIWGADEADEAVAPFSIERVLKSSLVADVTSSSSRVR